MTIKAEVILDSIAPSGARLTTFEITYPRFVHSECLRHRSISRNTASSRAIPVRAKIERIRKDCAKPSSWGINQKGMQASKQLDESDAKLAEAIWEKACAEALESAEVLAGLRCAACRKVFDSGCQCVKKRKLDVHKQATNRLLEPYDHVTEVVSATNLKNHWKLRLALDPETGIPMADPTYYELATKWKAAYDASTPRLLQPGDWHLPYVWLKDGGIAREDADALDAYFESQGLRPGIDTLSEDRIAILKKVSVGRVARTSYMRQGQGDVEENIKLHDRLASAGHWSPFEAVATPIPGIMLGTQPSPANFVFCGYCNCKIKEGERIANIRGARVCSRCSYGHIHSGNFHGWKQYRKEFADEAGGD